MERDGKLFEKPSKCESIAIVLFSLKDHKIYDMHFCFQLNVEDIIEHASYEEILDDNDLLINFDNRTCEYCEISEFENKIENYHTSCL